MSQSPGTTYKVGYFVGSLSSTSINRILSRSLIRLAPPDLEFTEIPIGNLPLYSPDHDADYPPEARALKDAIAGSDALLFVTPEYNRSIPGALKNAIDWASRPPPESPLRGKPAAIMGASGGISGTMRMQYHLRQIFVFTQTHVLLAPEVIIPRAAERFQDGRLADESTRALIGKQLAALREWTLRLSPRV
jgi:chromate reductase, NAD(P)H dehydrogenase (quinone)